MTAAGCLLWAATTAGFGAARTLQQGAVLWAINGVGLALVIPSGQSLIADYYPPASRGRAFGWLYLTGALGGMIGSLYATNLGMPSTWAACMIYGATEDSASMSGRWCCACCSCEREGNIR